jgi:hypothetical protein
MKAFRSAVMERKRQTPTPADAVKAVKRWSLFLAGAVLVALETGCATGRGSAPYDQNATSGAADYFWQTQNRWNQTHHYPQ